MIDIDVFKKPNENVVKVTMSEFRGQVYVHIRDYQMDGDTGYWFPTKNGYAFIAEETDSIIQALEEASESYAKYSRNLDTSEQLEFNFKEEND
jgi:cold shock CspA family protein|tara:strand:+ start:742 stop:1020 length:279 start_codon:yes stop_codon:yes gene_type:complete